MRILSVRTDLCVKHSKEYSEHLIHLKLNRDINHKVILI